LASLEQTFAPHRSRRFSATTLALLVACGCGREGEERDAADDQQVDQQTDEVDFVPDESTADEGIAPGFLRVVFFNVGTGDSILVQAPNGRTLLVDLGIPQVVADGQETAAAQHVVGRIAELTGRRYVDYFLASHYHSDHVGALAADGTGYGGIAWAVQSFGLGVGTFLDRGRTPAGDSPTQTEYLRWAENQTNRRVIDGPGADWVDLGPDVRVDVVAAPGAGVAAAGSPENGFSIPVRVTFGDLEIALAGDLTGDCDDVLVDIEGTVAPAMGAVEVYKVNHHGSQSSTSITWVEALHPLVSVFSLGVSRFGYPHDRTVAVLDPVSDLFYTRDGDIELDSTDGRAFTVAGRSYAARSDADEAALPDLGLGSDERTNALCDNGRDDDGDGYTDCDDFSCSQCPAVSICR
jgi:beta-lactamase superfamily II metal-dependent hydrolase